MEKTGFSYKKTTDDEWDVFSADFQLPDDGCPHSEQFLRVEVSTKQGERSEVALFVLSSGGDNVFPLGEFDTDKTDALVRLLYGGARLVTIKQFVPASSGIR